MGGWPLFLLCGWATAVGLVSTSGQDPQGSAPKRFSHAQHVGQVWFNLEVEEVWRDCRGCHRYDEAHPVSAPQQECDACHLPGKLQKQFAAGWQDDLGGYRTPTRDAFRHHTHGMLECRECHLPVNLVKVGDFDIVTGAGQCARCHDPAQAARNDFAELRSIRWFRGAQDERGAKELGVPWHVPPAADALAAYAQKLAAVFSGPTGGLNTTPLPVGGDFDHLDHGDIACVDCHSGIRAAAASDVGTGRIPEAACGKCHQRDAQGTPARVADAVRTTVRPLWSLGAFAHADHFRFTSPGAARVPGAATDEAYRLLAKGDASTCAVCHTQDQDALGLAARDFPFAAGKSRHQYLDCVVCHDGAGWRTGETAAAPLHDSTDGRADGASNGWAECARCHDFGHADFAAARPTTTVARHTGRVFQFPAHTHPDITRAGIARSGRPELQDCRTCHRARVPELPSRLEQREFRHDTHLPAVPTAKDCQACHPAAATAADAAGLGGAGFRTWSLAACASCHWGGDVREVEVAGVGPVQRPVVEFPHGPHAKAGAACTDCHELAKDGRDVATKDKALACSQCHDHAEGGPKTERLFGDEVKSCAHCHHADVAGRPEPALAVPAVRGTPAAAADPRYRSEQRVFAGFGDQQFHPLGGACTDCHRAVLAPDARWPGVRVPRQDHLWSVSTSPHAGEVDKKPVECLRCHWKPMDGGRFEAGVYVGSPEQVQWRKNPSGAATRAKFGNDSRGYPGTERAGG